MKIDLDPDAERFIDAKVKAGAFPSASAAVNGLLAQAKLQEEWTADDVAELRALVAVAAEQSARGESQPWDPIDFKQRLRAHLARTKAS
ncbi:MAG: type II toxin-antitoxin system ParD family antitoxin [Tepidisphaeraceae bacterium]